MPSVIKAIFLLLLLSVFYNISSLYTKRSHYGGLRNKLFASAEAEGASYLSALSLLSRGHIPTVDRPDAGAKSLFTKFGLCENTPSHIVLGLPSISSQSPPSAQAVWVAYYSRVVVAEHQPKSYPVEKLYCAALACRKMLYEIDPVMYYMYVPKLTEEEEVGINKVVINDIRESIESGNEVEAMLLHPDIFDANVVKAMLTLGWQEVKFYQVVRPVWQEWLEDEEVERFGWVDHMNREIQKLDERIEKIANEHIKYQVGDRLEGNEHKKMDFDVQMESGEGLKKSLGFKYAGGVEGGVRETVFRRLEGREHLSGVLEELNLKKAELLGARNEMEKVNDHWIKRKGVLLLRWENFSNGALDRVMSNNKAYDIEGRGESWETGMEHIAKLFSEHPKQYRDECEGYLLEMVLQENDVTGVSGESWKQQKKKNEALTGLLEDYNDNKGSEERSNGFVNGNNTPRSVTGDVGVNISRETVYDEKVDMFVDDMLEGMKDDVTDDEDIEWLIDSMLQDVDSLDLDMDEIIDELAKINEEELYRDVLEAAMDEVKGGVSGKEAMGQMLEGVAEIIDEMIISTEKTGGKPIDGVEVLAERLMRGGLRTKVGEPGKSKNSTLGGDSKIMKISGEDEKNII